MFWNKQKPVEKKNDWKEYSRKSMLTIHIFEKWSEKKQYKFIREMYEKFLHKDDLFHYFYEPDLIIRARNKAVIAEIDQYLKDHNILHEVYPYPDVKDPEYQYGDAKKGMTVKYMGEFLEAYHAISVFIIKAKTKDMPEIRAKLIHSMYNMDFKSYEYEGRALNNLGMNRMYSIGVMKGQEYKERTKQKEFLRKVHKKVRKTA